MKTGMRVTRAIFTGLTVVALLLAGLAGLALFGLNAARVATAANHVATAQPRSTAVGDLAAAPISASLTALYKTATPTPFQPRTYTPTPSPSPTATATPTVTPKPSATPTLTPVPTSTLSPTPTFTATPTTPPTATPEGMLPESASISGVYGQPQALPLTCEARSAVDWAAFFGVSIGEMEFQNSLPRSLNPNTGFVGSPGGARGGIPPADYGVHAAPVAELLGQYGLEARAKNGMTWDEIRREVASGEPVIAWVVSNVLPGVPVTYSAPDGEQVTVAAFEHTVIVTGYDGGTVTVVDNDLRYTVTLEQFLDSWGVLGNMGVWMENP